jgi:alkylation response protein AidB-like acyl-CoA dehydrogenase
MDLSLTETQEMLRKTARDFLVRECPNDVALRLDDGDIEVSSEIWQKMADLGWVGMTLPEEYGGVAANITDLAVLYEQFGWAALPSPHLSSSVLCGLTILAAGTKDQKQQLLPSIARGELILALALTEPHCNWGADSVRLKAAATGSGFVLDGVKLMVPDVHIAHKILCFARTRETRNPEVGITLFLVDRNSKGLSWRPLTGFLGERLNEVTFTGVEVPRSSLVGGLDSGWTDFLSPLRKATILLCEYMVGGCQRVFEMTAEYSRARIQFGVHIGTFQRVQDHVIDIANCLEAARWTTYEALWKLDKGETADREVSLAKVVASEAYYDACQSAHDVHAGAGIMKEYPLHLHTKKSRTLYHYLGDPAYHRKILAQLLAF